MQYFGYIVVIYGNISLHSLQCQARERSSTILEQQAMNQSPKGVSCDHRDNIMLIDVLTNRLTNNSSAN